MHVQQLCYKIFIEQLSLQEQVMASVVVGSQTPVFEEPELVVELVRVVEEVEQCTVQEYEAVAFPKVCLFGNLSQH